MKFEPGEFNVVCTDLERSLSFYRDVLGFAVVEEDAGAIRVRLGSMTLLLLPVARAPSSSGSYGSTATLSFDLVVPDLAAAAAYFASHGVPVVQPSEANSGFFVVTDPDGLHIEIVGG